MLNPRFFKKYIYFIIGAFMIYTAILIIPIALSFAYSFTNWDGYSKTIDFVGLKNFIKIFHSDAMLSALGNTFVFSLFNAIIITVLAIPLSLVFNAGFKIRNFVRSSFFFASVPSVLIIGYIFQLFFGPTSNGVINSFLGSLGIDPVKWLSKGFLPMFTIILTNVWRLTGWHACIYLARLQGISEEYYEASRIDGASKWNIFWYITFPLLAPAMTISMMLIIIDGLKIYALPYSLTGGGPGYRTTFMTQLIIETGIGEKMVGKSSAMAVVFFAVIMIVALIQLHFSRKREESIC
jgi:raffinose/stachyose/melibiose transport system permease protein